MAEIRGTAFVAKIDIAGTPTAFTYEITSRLTVGGDTITAQNKSTTGWVSQAPTTKNWQIEVDANVDDTSNPALDAVQTALMTAPTALLSDCVYTASTFSTYTGDAYPANWNIGGGSNDFGNNAFTLLGSGALVAS